MKGGLGPQSWLPYRISVMCGDAFEKEDGCLSSADSPSSRGQELRTLDEGLHRAWLARVLCEDMFKMGMVD